MTAYKDTYVRNNGRVGQEVVVWRRRGGYYGTIVQVVTPGLYVVQYKHNRRKVTVYGIDCTTA